MTSRAFVLATLLASLSGTGCDIGVVFGDGLPTDDATDDGPADDPREPGGGAGDLTPANVIYSGRYELTSNVDIAASGVFGDTISGTIIQLSMFEENPAGTILELMALFEVPVYTQVWNLIPGFIKGEFEDLLNEWIFENLFDAIPILDHVVGLIDDIGEAARFLEMKTEMTVDGPRQGLMRGTHNLRSLGFHLWDLHAVLPVPDILSDIMVSDVKGKVEYTNQTGRDQPRARFSFNKQTFEIPYGNMLMDFIRDQVFRPRGAETLSEWLNEIIDCPTLGSWLGNRCLLGVCIKDAVSISSLTGFCTGGLNTVGLLVESQVRSLTFELVDLADGTCQMYDVGYDDTEGDSKIDALADGTWATQIKLNGQTTQVRSDFEGRRIGDFVSAP